MALTFFLGLVSDVWQWNLLPCSVDQRQNCYLISFFSTSSLSPRSSPLFSNRRKDGLGGQKSAQSELCLLFLKTHQDYLCLRTEHCTLLGCCMKKKKIKSDDFKKFKQKIIWGGKLLRLIN